MPRPATLVIFVVPLMLLVATSIMATDRLKDTREIPSTTFGLPQDTFIVGCELYLFGRLIFPVEHGGKSGHRVTKSLTAVHVNDVVYFDIEAPVPALKPSEEAVRRVALYDSVAVDVRLQTTLSRGEDAVIFRGSKIEFNKEVTCSRTPDGTPVLVRFHRDSFSLRVKGSGAIGYDYIEKPDVPIDENVRRERLVDSAYQRIVRRLEPNIILFAGKGYTNEVRGEATKREFRRALAEIPVQARRLTQASPGGEHRYEPMTVRGFFFNGAEVRDVVDAAKD